MTGFNRTLKKLELSLRNGELHESVKYLSELTENAESEEELEAVEELGDIIASGNEDRLETFFDNTYEEVKQ